MCHIIESCPLTKLNGGLSRLHSADKDAFLGWPIMVHNMYTRRRRNPITNGYEDFCFIFPRNNVFVSTYRKIWLSTDQASGATSATDLRIHLRPVSDRCAVVQRVSRRRGNTGRQRQVVPGWCSTTSRRLQLNDLSEIESTAGLWVSTRYVDTCAQPRHVRPVLPSSCCTAHVVHLYIQVQHITYMYNHSYIQEIYLNGRAQHHIVARQIAPSLIIILFYIRYVTLFLFRATAACPARLLYYQSVSRWKLMWKDILWVSSWTCFGCFARDCSLKHVDLWYGNRFS